MSQIIYAGDQHVVVRIHTREEVRQLFEVLGSQGESFVKDVMPWACVALKLFAEEPYIVAFNEDLGYAAINLANNFVASNVEIEINHPDVQAYFRAMVEYHFTNKKEQDLELLKVLKEVLSDGTEHGYDLPRYKERCVQAFKPFELRYDFNSSTKLAFIDYICDHRLLSFNEMLVEGLPDFYQSREFLESLINQAKEMRIARASQTHGGQDSQLTDSDIDALFAVELNQNEQPEILVFTFGKKPEKYGLSPKLTDSAIHVLKSQLLVKNIETNRTINTYELIELCLDVMNNDLDLQEGISKKVMTVLPDADHETFKSCVAHLMSIANHPSVKLAIVERQEKAA